MDYIHNIFNALCVCSFALCLTLQTNPLGSVHGILGKNPECQYVFSRDLLSDPVDQDSAFCIAGGILTTEPSGVYTAQYTHKGKEINTLGNIYNTNDKK